MFSVLYFRNQHSTFIQVLFHHISENQFVIVFVGAGPHGAQRKTLISPFSSSEESEAAASYITLVKTVY